MSCRDAVSFPPRVKQAVQKKATPRELHAKARKQDVSRYAKAIGSSCQLSSPSAETDSMADQMGKQHGLRSVWPSQPICVLSSHQADRDWHADLFETRATYAGRHCRSKGWSQLTARRAKGAHHHQGLDESHHAEKIRTGPVRPLAVASCLCSFFVNATTLLPPAASEQAQRTQNTLKRQVSTPLPPQGLLVLARLKICNMLGIRDMTVSPHRSDRTSHEDQGFGTSPNHSSQRTNRRKPGSAAGASLIGHFTPTSIPGEGQRHDHMRKAP